MRSPVALGLSFLHSGSCKYFLIALVVSDCALPAVSPVVDRDLKIAIVGGK